MENKRKSQLEMFPAEADKAQIIENEQAQYNCQKEKY